MQTTGPTTAPMAEELRVLGLRPGASVEEVRSVYRRLARGLHPDRFHHLGPEAVARATPRFREVVRAAEALIAASAHRPTAMVADGVYRPSRHHADRAYAGSRAAGASFDTAA